MTFDKWVAQAAQHQDTAGDIMNFGHYVPQLELWFEHFAPSQFTIVPVEYVFDKTGHGEEPYHEHIWTSLGAQPSKMLPAKDIMNHKDHPTFSKDIQEENVATAMKIYMNSASPPALAQFFLSHDALPELWGCS